MFFYVAVKLAGGPGLPCQTTRCASACVPVKGQVTEARKETAISPTSEGVAETVPNNVQQYEIFQYTVPHLPNAGSPKRFSINLIKDLQVKFAISSPLRTFLALKSHSYQCRFQPCFFLRLNSQSWGPPPHALPSIEAVFLQIQSLFKGWGFDARDALKFSGSTPLFQKSPYQPQCSPYSLGSNLPYKNDQKHGH